MGNYFICDEQQCEDNDLFSADKATIAATEYTGADGKTHTIGEGIEYARNKQALSNTDPEPANLSFGRNNQAALVVTVICVLSLTALMFVLFEYKKHKKNQ